MDGLVSFLYFILFMALLFTYYGTFCFDYWIVPFGCGVYLLFFYISSGLSFSFILLFVFFFSSFFSDDSEFLEDNDKCNVTNSIPSFFILVRFCLFVYSAFIWLILTYTLSI